MTTSPTFHYPVKRRLGKETTLEADRVEQVLRVFTMYRSIITVGEEDQPIFMAPSP